MNLWYVAHDDEILVDMDKPTTSLPYVEMRIRAGVAAGILDLSRVEVHKSYSPSHLHAMLTLHNDLTAFERAVWAIMLHSDKYRACNNLMRIFHGVPAPDLLITPVNFLRAPDDRCECEEKHVGEVMDVCPAAIRLRGDDRCRSFFGKPERTDEQIRRFPDNGQLEMFRTNMSWIGRRF